jgi:3-oxoacyl-[acyl-carrier protein] reductase
VSDLVVVTGAASGIGRACAAELAAPGVHVAGVDIDGVGLAGTAKLVEDAGAGASTHIVDVIDEAAIRELAADLESEHGAAAVLVNVVGGARLATVREMSLAAWEDQVRFNLTSTFIMCQAFVEGMCEAGRGAIVNTSSGWGFMPAPGRSAYAASKAGVVAFSRALAAEVAPHGIRVNVVAPGPIETERMVALTRNDPTALAKQSSAPAGRLGQPEEVAAAVAFLASPAAAYVYGQVVHVNGGVFMP